MKNLELAALLAEVGDLLELLDENPFKVRAYRRAAQTIELLPEDVAAIHREGRLGELEGIGQALAAKISEWLETGTMRYYEDLRGKVPPGLIEMTAVPGVGPKMAQTLYRELGIGGLEELEAACRAQKLRRIKRMGPKVEANILRGIERLRQRSGRMPLGLALPLAQEIVSVLSRLPEVIQSEAAGSLRRRRDTIGDVDVLVASTDPEPVMQAFTELPLVRDVLARGTTRSSVVLRNGLQVDLRVVAPEEFAPALHYFTGSKEHNVKIRERARALGLKVSEYGVTAVDSGERLPIETEADLFAAVELAWIPPELREDTGEIEAAAEGRLPRLVEEADVRGDLHVHSTWSDGVSTIEDLAAAARARGYEYIAIADHSRSLGVARGLPADRLPAKAAEIEAVNARAGGVRVLRATEVDILADGRLDYPDEVLAELDVVVASIHSAFGQEEEKITQRLESAMKNEHVDIIGHPTGRILGRRDPYALSIERVLEVAARTGTALEINGGPDRLDLSDVHARRAGERGILIAVNTDAHSVDQFDQMQFAVAVARRAWLEPDQILNTRPLAELLRFLGRRR